MNMKLTDIENKMFHKVKAGDTITFNESGTFCMIFERDNEDTQKYLTLADVMEKYGGTQEYDGAVGECQKWFYGTLVEEPWCATWLCWCLTQLGLRNYTIKTKTDNVFVLFGLLNDSVNRGSCKRIMNPEDMKRGDIVILNFSEMFSTTANKHVTVYTGKDTSSKFEGIGGNQDDSVCKKYYDISNIYAIFRPDYTKEAVNSLEMLPDA